MSAISEVMSSPVESVGSFQLVSEVRSLMQDLGVHAVPVFEGDDLVGIVTSIDLADDLGESEPIANAMSGQVHTVHPGTDVTVAASFMRGLQINHLVVTDDDDLVVGIISAWDLLESLAAAVRAHTVDAVDVALVAPGDELVVTRPAGETLRCRVNDVRGPSGLPPYVVVWDDDPRQAPLPIEIVRHSDVTLDGCER